MRKQGDRQAEDLAPRLAFNSVPGAGPCAETRSTANCRGQPFSEHGLPQLTAQSVSNALAAPPVLFCTSKGEEEAS